MAKNIIDIYSAGCSICNDTIDLVNSIADSGCEITIHDTQQKDVANELKKHNIKTVPAVAINGKFADCCTSQGVDAGVLRTMLSN